MRRAHSLTRRFAVVSVIAMLLLGAGVVLVTSNLIAKQAMREGVSSAEAVAAYASTHIPATAWSTGVLTPVQRSAVDASTRGFGERLVRLRVWNVDGTLIFDSEGATTGFPDGQRLDHATRHESADSRVVEQVRGLSDVGGRRTQVLNVYIPITTSDGVAGAAEVNLDYTETAAALYDATRTIALVTVAGLVFVWLLLFSTVRSASRRLRSTARENARLAMLDSLTGLPNRRLLTERMRRAVDEAREDGSHIGLIVLDIDRFKDINDSLGHDYGDALLEQVAARLREALRQEDLVARLGGDEFAVLLPDIRSVEVADRMAQRVRSLFAAPFVVDGITLHASTSIGVACLPDHAQDSSSLMRRADVAMYTAKTHRLGVAVYSPDDDTSSPARLVLLGDLHRAIESTDQLELHYQPKVDLRDGRIVGYEALMRWNHPTRGTVMPGVFIPLAEQSGLIHDVTRFALTEAIIQLAHWQERGRAVPVAVNLSAHDVVSTDVVDLIDSLLAEHGVPRHLLEVEITETALVADPSRVLPALQRLSSNGVDVAIDDFGIGSTSISQLRSYPVQRLKIDRLFVTDLGVDQRAGSGSVVQAMVDLAHSFGMRVVAEGVEDRRSADILRELGVDEAQGFAYSTAVPARRMEREVPPTPRATAPTGSSRSASVAAMIRGGRSSKSDETPQVEARSGR